MQYRAPAVALVAAVRLDDAAKCASVLASMTEIECTAVLDTLNRAAFLVAATRELYRAGKTSLDVEMHGLVVAEKFHRPPG